MPVLDNGQVRGIITRQVADKAIYHGMGEQPVGEFMSREFRTVAPETPVDDLKELIVAGTQRFVPVLRGEQLVGAVTRTDLLRHLATSSGGAPRAAGLEQAARQASAACPGPAPDARPSAAVVQVTLAASAPWPIASALAIFVVGGFVRDLLLNLSQSRRRRGRRG